MQRGRDTVPQDPGLGDGHNQRGRDTIPQGPDSAGRCYLRELFNDWRVMSPKVLLLYNTYGFP